MTSTLRSALTLVQPKHVIDVINAGHHRALWLPMTEEMRLAERINESAPRGKRRGHGEPAFSYAIDEEPSHDNRGIDFSLSKVEVKELFNEEGKHQPVRVGAMGDAYRELWWTPELRLLAATDDDAQAILYRMGVSVSDFQRLVSTVLRPRGIFPTPGGLLAHAGADWLVVHGRTAVGQLVLHASFVDVVLDFHSITQGRFKLKARDEMRQDLAKIMLEGP